MAGEKNENGKKQQALPNPLPTPTLPKGGGAIRGIGEKFAANPVTGTGSLTVPISTSPGRSGFGPQLSLSYDSGAGNGPFGFGWSLALPSITRKTDKGLPQYQDAVESDVFILSGAEDLVPLLIKNNGTWARDVQPRTLYGQPYVVRRYRPRVEGLFARIEHWINSLDPKETFWRSLSKDNITTWYGRTAESRIADPTDPTRIFTWLICESYDDKGNVIAYHYKPENSDNIPLSRVHERNRSGLTRSANRYIKRIQYGNRTPYFPDPTAHEPVALPSDGCFEVVFDYGEHDEKAPLPQETGKTWDCRKDPFSIYRATFEVRTYRLCQRVLMFHHFPEEAEVGRDCLVRSTDFTYSYEETPADPRNPIFSFLFAVTQTGYRSQADGYLSKSLPPLEFEYTQPTIDETVREVDRDSLENLPYGLDGSHYQWVDLDGEGLSGVLTEQGGGWFYKRNLSPVNRQSEHGREMSLARFGPVELVARKPSLAALSGGRQQLLDLAGEGQLDLVDFEGPTPGFYERTDDADWEPFAPFTSLPVLDWSDPNLKFVDLTGDGHADAIVSHDDAFCWHTSLAEAGFGPEARVLQALDEEQGPKLLFTDGTYSIFLADLSGDGLNDLVRIRNGEACYWPNLGYGRFGAKITMDQAPRFEGQDLFDGRRIRLADIDGSGTTDIIYFASSGVQLYFNQSGNGWSERHVLREFPPVESLSSATALDLLGNGTACLAWSSPLPGNARRPMRYMDLMGGQKPHLLVKVINNLGAETRVQYAPSTKFYVADRLAGTPWLTRIPFPVHVVERVETYDYVSRNRFVTRYAYHHGYYDGIEREFRGFGMVEQWDTEEFAALTDSPAFPDATNIEHASNVPPVRTKTWFHTGAYFEEARVSKHFEEEYYREGDTSDAIGGLTEAQLETMLLDDTVLPTTLRLPDGTRISYAPTGEETREAGRALRGSILRQEIYALDGTDEADRPYSASERNYTIEALQPQGPNRYAVFFTHPRETIDFHYERKLFKFSGDTLADPNNPPLNAKEAADPRVTHAITLAVDVFGNVLQSVAIGYGRRYKDPTLTSEDQAKQGTTLVTYTENRYTNPVLENGAYRLPLPSEARTYELIKVTPDASQLDVTNLFRFDEVLSKVEAASDGQHDLPYEDVSHTGAVQAHPYRRPIEAMRTLYRPNDLGVAAVDPKALLPLGQLQSLAIMGESYKLAFTSGLLAQVYQRGPENLLPTPSTVLGGTGADNGGYVDLDNGGYVDLDNDGHWWIPSGRMFHHPDPNATPQQELDQSRQHFFLPRRFEDPFGQSTTVDYDPYDLLVLRTTDAVKNKVTAVNDYRVLQPALLTDPNENRAAASFDALGLVAGTAVMGKTSENLGDSLVAFSPELTPQQIDGFYHAADPHTAAGTLLGNATTRIVYDLDRFRQTRAANPGDPTQWEPVFAATIARETHVSDLAPNQETKLQISFSYSDGFGREIQKKIQAEPETAAGPLRWVGSGWTIFNNKGKPVRQYEPFFDDTHDFRFAQKVGVSPILFYDPVERMVATLHPNHTYEKVVFDPWRQATYDVNDTVLFDPKTDPAAGEFFARLADGDYLPTWYQQRSNGGKGPAEQEAAAKAAAHADTPTVAHFDSLGRTFLTIADNGKDPNGNAQKYRTRTEIDIEGNQRAVIDAKDRVVMRYDYDMLRTRIHQASMEAGEHWMLNEATGKPIRAWDSRHFTRSMTYDALRRPTGLFVSASTLPEVQAEKTVYGESQPNSEAANLRTKPYQVFDGAGVITTPEYDFNGNLVRSERQLLRNYKDPVNWLQSPPLEEEKFTGRTRYDALNRPIQLIAPHSDRANTLINVIQPVYNEANLLERVQVWLKQTAEPTKLLDANTANLHAVTNIDYDAKGQRTLIEYGNGVETHYTYDEETFRLIRLQTLRGSTPLQDLQYAYDPTGNITQIRDDAQKPLFHDNQQVLPENHYVYDAIYRLIHANGREHIGQATPLRNPNQPSQDFPDLPVASASPNDPQAMRHYEDIYGYDEVGNILSVAHQAGPGSWTRAYTYAEPSLLESGKVNNRLSHTDVGNATETYGYRDVQGQDVNSCMTSINTMRMDWDFKEQLARVDLGGGGTAYYVYDAGGQRVRKAIERTGTGGAVTRIEERIYLGGFEVYRESPADRSQVTLERETLHVMDDKKRIALVEARTHGDDGSPLKLIRYQLDNHLGSACLELDDRGVVFFYEEYYPYGTTSYQAVDKKFKATAKRYRYTGKERDEETGFSYHGARYYAPWVGRWVSCDPAGHRGIPPRPNLYEYASNNPITFHDPDGRDPTLGGSVTNDERGLRLLLSGSTSHPNLSLGLELSISPDRGVDTSLRGGLIAGGSVYSFGAGYKDYTHTASAQFATNKAFSLGDVHVSSVAARARFTPSEWRGVPALRVEFTGNLAGDVPVENYPPPGRANLIGSLAGSLRLGSDLSVRGNVSGRVGLTIPIAEVRFSAQFRGALDSGSLQLRSPDYDPKIDLKFHGSAEFSGSVRVLQIPVAGFKGWASVAGGKLESAHLHLGGIFLFPGVGASVTDTAPSNPIGALQQKPPTDPTAVSPMKFNPFLGLGYRYDYLSNNLSLTATLGVGASLNEKNIPIIGANALTLSGKYNLPGRFR